MFRDAENIVDADAPLCGREIRCARDRLIYGPLEHRTVSVERDS